MIQDTKGGDILGDLRAVYHATQYAGLGWSPVPDTERPVDRVAAAAKAPLIDLWRDDAQSLRSLHQKALIAFRDRYKGESRSEIIVSQALTEYLNPHCAVCRGAGHVLKPTQMASLLTHTAPCSACDGSGIRKHTDEVRARSMRVSTGTATKIAGKINWALSWLGGKDRSNNATMNRELERMR